ncbi:hypothetical protein Palpr_2209 [Paludibacter propionicigenes WB4]|uniref:Uncharacterized protein n=1 Tax=Paludibacter propionicigenes (strain DSM 17365 / JCM 13257 / WB4) TaxID=694427 RepID=E4T6K1_PALPW|nr:hypothetical protein [Paludibacter propionicigenes]ADQ80345.1 hypothetical protein Palpr_2209 [Paludibacter propionicigenes WB4]
MNQELTYYRRFKKNFEISDFLVDFLGALCPGLLFCLAIVLTFGSTSIYLIYQIKALVSIYLPHNENINAYRFLDTFSSFVKGFSFYFALVVLVSSYVLGQFLYRKDPKDADNASYLRILKKENKKNKNWGGDWVEHYKIDELKNCVVEYPYRYLKSYFEKRGLLHLAKIIPWDETDFTKRSKTFINLLKIRINYYRPDCMGEILKNEGHIRLMSSLWHSLRYIKTISLLCIFANILISLINLNTIQYLLIPIYCSIVVYIFAKIWKIVIESFYHYQRAREVFFVLETAYIVSLDHNDIFKSINYSSSDTSTKK